MNAKKDKEKTNWCTPQGNIENRVDYWKEFRKRKEVSPAEENEKSKRRAEESEIEQNEEEAFAKSGKTPRSPVIGMNTVKGEEKQKKLNMEMMLDMIVEKQNDLIQNALKGLKQELKERDKKREVDWENKWKKWVRETEERKKAREERAIQRNERRRMEEKEEREKLEESIKEIERELIKIKEKERRYEEREEEWIEMKREYEEWRESRNQYMEKRTNEEEKEEGNNEEKGKKESRLQRLADGIEKERKKLNVVVIGFRGEWDKGKLEKWIKEKLEIDVKIEEVWRVGTKKEKIIAKCKDMQEKENILKNKKKLGKGRVFIDNDLTYNERRIRERTLDKARES